MKLLDKITTLEHDAAAFGFQWENTDQLMAQIHSECLEITEHLKSTQETDRAALQEEIGDLLHAVFSLCVFCNMDPEETLQGTLEKFERRLQAVKAIAKEQQL
ncbi:MAG: MazG nucleotide pyrophosphohydrolase domain-containing protein, partial [Methylococcales bacterium]|nr:MazG nucleotide pyrophosphohydrolase domain-containing protein [Methylococcales bacterium]